MQLRPHIVREGPVASLAEASMLPRPANATCGGLRQRGPRGPRISRLIWNLALSRPTSPGVLHPARLLGSGGERRDLTVYFAQPRGQRFLHIQCKRAETRRNSGPVWGSDNTDTAHRAMSSHSDVVGLRPEDGSQGLGSTRVSLDFCAFGPCGKRIRALEFGV